VITAMTVEVVMAAVTAALVSNSGSGGGGCGD
jgi:hypothetical protein